MTRYGTYTRYTLFINEQMLLECMEIRIQRLSCVCGCTHALLPGDVVPFHNYNYIPFLSILLFWASQFLESTGKCKKSSSITERLEKWNLSYPLLRYFLMIFRIYEKRLMAELRINGWYSEKEQASSAGILTSLSAQPPPLIQREYFRIFRSPLFLSRQNTAAYPLCFCVRDL